MEEAKEDQNKKGTKKIKIQKLNAQGCGKGNATMGQC